MSLCCKNGVDTSIASLVQLISSLPFLSLVPQTGNELSTWVRMNREQYHRMVQKKEPWSMTPERVKLLEKIEFVWDAREAAWQERFQELEEFVKVNGRGCMPPKKTHASLLQWLKYQKKLYREKCKGKEVSLTEKRIADLKRLGFILDYI